MTIDFKDPKQRMAHARKHVGVSPGRAKVDEKSLYDKTMKQVYRILVDETIEQYVRKNKDDLTTTDLIRLLSHRELIQKYHLAILRWQGKLDAVDDKQIEELRKLMGKKAS